MSDGDKALILAIIVATCAALIVACSFMALTFSQNHRIISLCESKGGVVEELGTSLQCQIPGEEQKESKGKWLKVE
jgi:uncharacterized membrane protein affecting hemolysin expression